jgi:protein FrlC
MALAGETIADYHHALGSDLVHIHFVDGKPRGHLAWGDGVLPLAQYMRTLEGMDYRGSLTLEITDSSYIMDPAKADARSLQALLPYLAQ